MINHAWRDGLRCLASWRTSAAGLALLTIAGLEMAGVQIDHLASSPEILIIGGLGFLFARDAAAKR